MTRELAAAIEASLAAGEVLMRHRGESLRVSYKGDVNLVTEADLESERTVLAVLGKRFPRADVLAEESGSRDREAEERFIVDPLDGTTNFAHGYPVFSVSIAFERRRRIEAAVVYDPLREELFTAERGRGAFLNGRKLEVSAEADVERALLITGFPYDRKEDLTASLRLFHKVMRAARAVRRDGSAALDLCFVAAGRADGFWEAKLSPWDTAAGALVVTEAGGRVSNLAGGDFDAYGGEVVATNGRVHEALLRVLAEPEASV